MNIIKLLKTLKPEMADRRWENSLFLLAHFFVLICAGRLPVGINVAQLSSRWRQRRGEREMEKGVAALGLGRCECVGLGLELHAKSVDKAFSQLELNEREPGEPPLRTGTQFGAGIEQGLISGARDDFIRILFAVPIYRSTRLSAFRRCR